MKPKRSPLFPIFLFLLTLLCTFTFPSLATLPPSPSPIHQVFNQTDLLQLEQQSKTLYDAGRFREAIPLLQRIVQEYEAQGNGLRQAIALGNLALNYQQIGDLDASNQAIQTSLALLGSSELNGNGDRPSIQAQVLDIQGRLHYAQGNLQQALTTWQQAAHLYEQLGDQVNHLHNQIDQSRVLQGLGLYRQAKTLLDDLTQTLQTQPDSLATVAGLRSLGDALRGIGDWEAAREPLQRSLAIAQQLLNAGTISEAQGREAIALSQLSLGNVARSESDQGAALELYQQAATTASSSMTQIQAQINQFSVLVDDSQWDDAQALMTGIEQRLNALPLSQTTVYAQIHFAQEVMQGRGHWAIASGNDPNSPLYVARWLAKAIQQAEALQDTRTRSYAIGHLGGLYEITQQWTEAETLTRQALHLAQELVYAPEITYLWQWQLGRVLKAQAEQRLSSTIYQEATVVYEQAIQTLQTLRIDLVAANRDEQFSFRETVEPAYRQFIELLLQSTPTAEVSRQLEQTIVESQTSDQENLAKARTTLEALQAAELRNFFREACADIPAAIDQIVERTLVEQSTSRAAVIYPIILPDHLDIVLKLPQQTALLHYSTAVSQDLVKTTLQTLRHDLIQPDKTNAIQTQAEQVYDWLIRPAETVLADYQINTLVFVLDGYLKNIPMAALYDGNQYLIENYSIALAPGLQIPDPKALDRQKIRLLFAGLSQTVENENFPPLLYVPQELEGIRETIPDLVALLNDDFTAQALQAQLNADPFQVVHLATHGVFSANLDETFILDSQGRINVTQLDEMLRTRDLVRPEPIELLVLSACQTATGDERAALGMAGIAVRAGARSTLASLWSVDDQASSLLMADFYRQLKNPSFTKAEALRQAQLKFLQSTNYNRPHYWAPFVLLGNWL